MISYPGRLAALVLCVLGCANEENLGNTITSGRADWAIALGGRGYEGATAVAIDSTGDVIVGGGGFAGTVDFGSGPVGNLHHWAFISKRAASDGGPIWTVPVTGLEDGASDDLHDIAIGPEDSIYVTGEYSGTVDFGGTNLVTTVASEVDMYVAKYTGDGTLAWVRGLGPLSAAAAYSIAVDGDGNAVVLGGIRQGSFEFLGEPHVVNLPRWTSFVASFSSDGQDRWFQLFDSSVQITGLAGSHAGDIVVAGTFDTTASLGGAVLSSDGTLRGCAARYRGDGSFVWSTELSPADRVRASSGAVTHSVTIDANDRIVVDGTLSNGYLQPVTLVLNELSVDGVELATEQRNIEDSMGPFHVISHDRVVSAYWSDAAENAESLDAPGFLAVTAFDMSGGAEFEHIGKRLVGSQAETVINAAAVGPQGEVALAGTVSGQVSLGAAAIEAHGTNDTDALVIVVPPTN